MKEYPAAPLSSRAYTMDGFRRDKSGCFDVDFDKMFPDAQEGDYAYAYAQFRIIREIAPVFNFGSTASTEVYVNGERVTKTMINEEWSGGNRAIDVPAQLGYNTIFVKCKKDGLGFGFRFGSQKHKANPIEFYKAFEENAEELGWNYCGPFKEDIYPEPLTGNPSMEEHWLPRPYNPAMPNIKGHHEMYAVSTLVADTDNAVTFCAQADAEMELYIDGELQGKGNQKLVADLNVRKGTHAVAVRLFHKAADCTFTASAEGAKLALPSCTKNVKGQWLYLDSKDERAKKGFDQYQLYDGYESGEKTHYMCGENTYLRPVLETERFGRIDYPNGVTLYGLREAGKYLQDEEVMKYVHDHLEVCYGPLELGLWEMEKFGWGCVAYRLLRMNMLNDCGSFCAMVLEDYMEYSRDERILFLAEHVADYIRHGQERLENGMFYREVPGLYQELTIWADDVYMSIPFMVRYAQLMGDTAMMDDAVNQLLCYKEKLFMPEHNLLGHVYSLRYGRRSNVPWGRGNGWVLISLTEMLRVLPKEHKHYGDIELFFRQLAEGFLKDMDSDGMLHQVLGDMDSFQEASATAMGSFSFARGIQMGILPEAGYKEGAKRTAEALKKLCIDEEGNIYGVCRGSGCSFRRDYYKNHLICLLNDVHGMGLVLIALVDVARLLEEN
ncbi:MAG: glycoside hydrolase family 88 protein [Lachnospiraceae bacterium]|nr:glycoside hydrolase family 88 protein [Lachnospiraceae bacterium]